MSLNMGVQKCKITLNRLEDLSRPLGFSEITPEP